MPAVTSKEPFVGWEWWLERKERWVRDPEPQLPEGIFRAIAAGTGLPPIWQRSTFAFENVRDGADRFLGMAKGGERPFARIYTRLGNPTTEYLERQLFRLEAHHVIEKALAVDEREPTIGCLIASSGMGAIATLLLSLLRSGDAVMAGNIYGCTDSLLRGLEKYGVGYESVDMANLEAVERRLDANPNDPAVFLETPENPTLAVADIEAISRMTDSRGVALIVDNTFCSPYLQQPFRLGADFVDPFADEVRQRPLDLDRRSPARPVPFPQGGPLPLVQGPGRHPFSVRLVAERNDAAESGDPRAGGLRVRRARSPGSSAGIRRSGRCTIRASTTFPRPAS